MNQQRINSMLGESIGKFNDRDFSLAAVKEEKLSTSLRHFAGIGIENRSIRRESIVLRRSGPQRGSENYNPPSASLGHEGIHRRVSSTLPIVPSSAVALTGSGAVEITDGFSGETNLPDSARVEEVSEYLANETIAQLRAAGLRD